MGISLQDHGSALQADDGLRKLLAANVRVAIVSGVRGRLTFHDTGLFRWLDEREDSTAVHARIARASPPPYLGLFDAAVGTGWFGAAS